VEITQALNADSAPVFREDFPLPAVTGFHQPPVLWDLPQQTTLSLHQMYLL
jgi:hypothetical protein